MNARAEKYIKDHSNPIVKKPEPFGSKLLLSPLNEEQEKSLDNYLKELERILRHDRVDRRCARSIAEWIPEEKLAKVTKITKGSASFGFQNKTGKFLSPEETLFLLEMNRLELKYNNMPVSIEQAFKFIDNLDKYLLFKKLTLQGYKLKQENPNKEKSSSTSEEDEEPPNKVAKIAENDSEIDKIFIKLREKGPKTTGCVKSTESFDYLIKSSKNDVNIKLIDKEVLANAINASGDVYAIQAGTNLALMKLSNENIPILSSKPAIDMSSPKVDVVKDLIKSDTVVIFSKSYCPYCKLAKEVFSNLKQKFTAVELDSRDDCDEIQGILGELTGAKTVPRVFVKGECLGGGSDVKALYEKGELQKYFA